MDNFENLQTNNEKQHYIPMEVTAETIKDFGINPADVVWTRYSQGACHYDSRNRTAVLRVYASSLERGEASAETGTYGIAG